MCRKLMCLVSLALVLGVVWASPAKAVDPNLAGWWKFDGDGLDASGNGRNGTLAGDAHFEAGYFSQALALDGNGDYFTVNGWKGLMSTSAVTVSAWVNTTAAADEGDIMYWGRNSGTRRVDFRINAGRLRVEHGSGNIQGDTTLNDGEWHHVALTMPAAAEISYPYVKLYLDGRDDTRHTTDPDAFNLADNANNVDLTIGRRVPQNDRLFIGLIDDARIYDAELTSIQIRDLATLGYLATAHSPSPADGQAYEDTWATLKWVPGPLAASHDVYFSTSFDDVNAGDPAAFVGNVVTASQPVGFPGFPAPDGLVPGTTYYWRVDEVNDANPDSPWRGNVWSFWIPALTAYDPVPGDGEPAEPTNVVLSWSPGLKSIMNAVYFGTDRDQVANGTGAPPNMGTTYDPGPLAAATTYYWRVDTFNGSAWLTGPVWTFTTRPDIPVSADPNLVAWWKLDEGTGTNALDWSGHDNHGKLFGPAWTSPNWLSDTDDALTFPGDAYMAIDNLHYNDANGTEVSVCAWIRTSDPNNQYIVSFDRNEYYRLEIAGNGGGPGQVGWDIMTMSAGNNVQIDYGSATRVDDGLWHHVCGVFDHGVATIYIDGVAEPSATGGPTFGLGNTRYGFLGANSEATEFNGARGVGTGITGDLGEVRIYNKALTQDEILQAMRGDPAMAWDLRPTNGRILQAGTVTSVSWRPGDGASQHDVYFGADANTVANADASDTTGVYRGRQNGTSYTPPEGFDWGQTYYWRIDETAADGTIAKGRVHAIKIADYLVVDDFEAYNAGDNQIWYAWHDGLGYGTPATPPYFAGNGTGSAVGDETTASYTEETIVNSGQHSMPVAYDNNKQGFAMYSEVEMTLTAPRDWTANGVEELSLWYVGDPCNAAEPMYVAITNAGGTAAVVYNDDPNLVTGTWTEWMIPLQAFTDQGVDLKNVNSIAIGIGTRGNMTVPGGSGKMYFDDIRLYRRRPVTIVNPSFELPGTEKQTGFDNVPGWSTDAPCEDSGVETGYTPTDGDWTAYLKSGDPSVWQLTNHTITEWDVLEMKVDARITWAATTLKMTIYYDDNGTRVPVASQEVTLSDAMQEYSLSFSASDVPAAVGHKIGVEFSNTSTGETWAGIDNVRLGPPAQ
jgi:Concanavalin A-like lectin/glucanases superfamily/HpiC1 cyclase